MILPGAHCVVVAVGGVVGLVHRYEGCCLDLMVN